MKNNWKEMFDGLFQYNPLSYEGEVEELLLELVLIKLEMLRIIHDKEYEKSPKLIRDELSVLKKLRKFGLRNSIDIDDYLLWTYGTNISNKLKTQLQRSINLRELGI